MSEESRENPKLKMDKMIIYTSELPYLGNGLVDKYVWLKDTESFESPQNPNDTKVYGIIGNNIEIGDIKQEKGIEVTVNGTVYYVNANGEVSN